MIRRRRRSPTIAPAIPASPARSSKTLQVGRSRRSRASARRSRRRRRSRKFRKHLTHGERRRRLAMGSAACYPLLRSRTQMAHLKPVPDPKPDARDRREALDRGARALRDRAAACTACACSPSRSRATSTARSRPPTSSPPSTSGCCATTRRNPKLARARPLRALQGPRRADPVRGARRARLLPGQGPAGPAPDRLAPAGPPRHEPDQRDRGLDRLARPGPLDVGRHLPGAAPRRPRRHRARLHADVRRRLPGGRELGGRDVRAPTTGSRT